jgi:hypothetical protein
MNTPPANSSYVFPSTNSTDHYVNRFFDSDGAVTEILAHIYYRDVNLQNPVVDWGARGAAEVLDFLLVCRSFHARALPIVWHTIPEGAGPVLKLLPQPIAVKVNDGDDDDVSHG